MYRSVLFLVEIGKHTKPTELEMLVDIISITNSINAAIARDKYIFLTKPLNLVESYERECDISNMKIAALEKYRRDGHTGLFAYLPLETRRCAERWLHYFCQRRRARGLAMESWLIGIYCGQAKRLALNPPSPAWGKSMLAKRGGYAVQRRYILEGRTGPRHPAQKAARVSAQRRNERKREDERERLGYPPPARHGFTNLEGI